MTDHIQDDDSSPRHKHLRKLAAEAEALKKAKQNPTGIEIEIVYDTRGKPKYRKISRMPNGNKHSEYISPKMGQQLKNQKK